VPASPDYSIIRQPVWIIGHIVAMAALISFILLGMWQLGRRNERSDLDVALERRLDQPVVALDSLTDEAGLTSAIEYRQVRVTGTYLAEDEVILQARSHEGRSGHEVLTPLLLDDGTAIVVDRGWVPIDVSGPPVVGAEVPTGPVEITGYLRQTQVRAGLGPVDPPDGTLERIARVDIERLQQQSAVPLREVWLQLATQTPEQAALPIAVNAPEPGGGPPHFSYAMQWFAFAAVVGVAYPILMYRTARRRQ
jgi:cytochrome oxidase assembly protein ShyY1